MPSKPSKTTLAPSIEFEALGTQWFIEVAGGVSPELERSIHSKLELVSHVWSRFRDDSLVAAMAHVAGDYELEPRDIQLLQWYRTLYDATDGAVTPLIGQTISDAGYDTAYRLRPDSVITATPVWDDIVQITKTGARLACPVLLDVGAAGKGYAIDRVAALCGDQYVIDAGGDIRVSGGNVQRIGLEHPRDATKLIGTVDVRGRSICGSASNRRTWADGAWHHIIDPHTSQSTRDVIATWVTADTAMIADGLATALFFIRPERLEHVAEFDYIVVHADGQVRYTHDSTITLFGEEESHT